MIYSKEHQVLVHAALRVNQQDGSSISFPGGQAHVLEKVVRCCAPSETTALLLFSQFGVYRPASPARIHVVDPRWWPGGNPTATCLTPALGHTCAVLPPRKLVPKSTEQKRCMQQLSRSMATVAFGRLLNQWSTGSHPAPWAMTRQPVLGGLPQTVAAPGRDSLATEPGPVGLGHPCSGWRWCPAWGGSPLRDSGAAGSGKGLGAASGRRACGGGTAVVASPSLCCCGCTHSIGWAIPLPLSLPVCLALWLGCRSSGRQMPGWPASGPDAGRLAGHKAVEQRLC